MNSAPSPSITTGIFPCHPLGYIRHWLVTGPHDTPYQGPKGEEYVLRRESVDHTRATPPASASLGEPGPFGDPWRFYYRGENFFVEHTAFYHGLTLVDSYAFTEIESSTSSPCEARLWVAGAADLWVNDGHIIRHDITRYMYPDFKMVELPLQAGINRICVRLQCFCVRDTRILFGLQILDRRGLMICVPGAEHFPAANVWLDSVRTSGRDTVTSSLPSPAGASIAISGLPPIAWPAGSTSLSLGAANPFRLSAQIVVGGQTLRRTLEIPANRTANAAEIPADLRKARLSFIGRVPAGEPAKLALRKDFLPLLARRLSGTKSDLDSAMLDAVLAFIDNRGDCADFALATLLRLESLGLATAAESAKIRHTALAFRYWSDEPGSDAMCFWSENHSLLFHGCQMIAGRLYPEEVFTTSGRTGADQAALGVKRCREWLDRIEPRGLEEFNSGTYLPITVGALLNVVDFSGDAAMSRRTSLLLDRIYENLALHSFEGVVVSPQGRVYRNVLYPAESGAQALLSDATAKAPPEFLTFSSQSSLDGWTGEWITFPASSPNYRPPTGLENAMDQPVSKCYRQGDAEIVLHKTAEYLLTSLAIPSRSTPHFEPGMGGYQQHICQATLGSECHVFINHPGCSFDEGKSRPGYWFGNGVYPRLSQHGGTLQAIFDIPDGSERFHGRTQEEWQSPPFRAARRPYDLHPVPFTHVHWPSDAFDRQEIRDHWLFGQKNSGFIAVWCSEKLQPHDEVLTAREYRALAGKSAWIIICGSTRGHGSMESFIDSCLARQPEFTPASLILRMTD